MEVAANGVKRMSIKMKQDLTALSNASAEEFAALYRAARFNQDALLQNEVATLSSVMELAPNSKVLADYVAALKESTESTWEANGKSIDAAMKAKAAAIGVAPLKITLTAEEKAASKIYPKATAKVTEYGYGVLNSIPAEAMTKHGFSRRDLSNTAEVAKLTTGGTNSILDIKKMLDAQFPNNDSLEAITKYMAVLKEAGLVEY